MISYSLQVRMKLAPVHHVSRYIGDGLMIHTPNASNVEIIPLNTPGYFEKFSGGWPLLGRIIEL